MAADIFPLIFSADKAGIKVSDRIVSIEGQTVQNKSVSELQARISGTPGSVVTLLVTRASAFWGVPTEIKVDLTRELSGACASTIACVSESDGERIVRESGPSSLPLLHALLVFHNFLRCTHRC
jgi:hypothetical protein